MYHTISKRLASWVSRIGLAVAVLSLTLLAGAPQPADAAGVVVNVTALGSGFQFAATTSGAPVTWDIWLNSTSIEYSPYPPHFPSPPPGTLAPRTRRASTSTAQTSFSPVLRDLLPNKTYNYIVRAGSFYTTGQATTLNRQVTITFNQIDVIDDSDDLSAGDLSFRFFVNGTEKFSFGASASSGETLNPNKVFASFLPGTSMSLKVVGVDDDCDFGQLCTSGIPSSGSGSHADYDWATAESGSINIAQLGPDTNSFSKTVTFEARGYALEFKVFAKIDVRYF
jgi:hypothetical protein